MLYDQYDNPGSNSWQSQNYEAQYDGYDNELADDFVVPSETSWDIDGVDVQGVYYNGPGPATSVNVRVYANGSGDLPGALICERLGLDVWGEQMTKTKTALEFFAAELR